MDARNAVLEALREEPPGVTENFARNFAKSADSPAAWDNLTDWADSIVSRMKGVIHGKPDIANGTPGPDQHGPLALNGEWTRSTALWISRRWSRRNDPPGSKARSSSRVGPSW